VSLTRVRPGSTGTRAEPLSPARVLTAVALAAWASLFVWLLATDRTALYLSSRTAWVVPMGASILCVALLGRLASLRSPHAEPVTPRAALAAALIVAPVVVLLALPPASLGTYAAARRSSLAGAAGFGGSSADIRRGDVSLVDVAGALRSRDSMKALVARAGTRVSFVGFVARTPGMPADEFLLTRFLVSCCAADALSIQVRVVGAPPGRFAPDDWVRVEGSIYPLGQEVLVDAAAVDATARPELPYLTP
jgi:putative membrane protein